jgi:hypothetical protein
MHVLNQIKAHPKPQVAFRGFCPLFVLNASFMLTSGIVLLTLGILWSCTRGEGEGESFCFRLRL